MKKFSFFVFAFFACLLLIVSQPWLTAVSAQNAAADSDRSSVIQKNLELAATIKRLTNRSSEGLIEEKLPDGGFTIDLQGRFQNVMLSKLDEKGDVVTDCVTSLEEANAFFGRNLETGEPIPSPVFQKDDTATLAARHGMSEGEFEFYKNLIEDAAIRRQSSPNAATITIVNADGAGEGFNSMAAPAVLNEGGNTGTTLGQQRLNLFNFAAGIWGAYLDSSVTINVNSQFNPLTPCSTSGGVLGSAGTVNINRDFANAPFSGTWYHAALANKIAGSDLIPANPEINATFNSDVDTGCLGAGTRFYYGLNNSTPGGTVNLLVVLLHEMGHGLGFSSFVNGSTGALNSGFPDVYTRFMFDRTANQYWYLMTDAQRQASALNTGNVLWDGANVKIASGFLTAGRDATTGRVQLFTPNPLQQGSSISHWDTAAFANLLMEPVINSDLTTTLDLTRQEMRDIGWYRDTTADLIPDTITGVTPNSGTANIGFSKTITWTNTGGFNRNVTIELSTDGGTTYPTIIASNIANTGSYSWTVPNSPTTQARVRVREFDFVAPLGASSGNFVIASPTAAMVSVSGRVTDAMGRGISGARILATGNNGATIYAMTNAFGYFRYGEIASGETYVFQATHKRYTFTPQVVSLTEDLNGMNFVAQP